MKINKVYHGDCLRLMRKIDNKSIDMILCDLPYGTTACSWDTIIPFEPLWKQYKRIIKDNGAIVLFGSQPFTTLLINSNLSWFKYDWIWVKNRPSGSMTTKKQPMKNYENICIFYKKHPTYNPQMIKRTTEELKRLSKKSVYTSCNRIDNRKWNKSGNRKDNKLKYPINIIKTKTVFNRSLEKTSHPTQKPVELCEYLIKTYTNEGELVLDNCSGSGTTGVACKKTKRNYILMEKKKEYVDIAIKRIAETRVNQDIVKLIWYRKK